MDTEAQATRWLIRLDAARSPELIEEHAKWMAESTRNRVAYMRLSVAWKRMDAVRRMRPLDPPGTVDPDLLKPHAKRSRGFGPPLAMLQIAWLPRLAVGIAILAAFAVVLAALIEPAPQVTYSTPIGGHQHVILDDGSVLRACHRAIEIVRSRELQDAQ